MTCQNSGCGHGLMRHDAEESGMGDTDMPCMTPGCECENYVKFAPTEKPPVVVKPARRSCATPFCGHRPDEHYDDGPCAANCACVAYSERVDDQTVVRQVDPEPGRSAGTKALTRYVDSAMFTAEPINADEGPKVHLLWMTADPLAVIAAPSKMYKGEVARSLRDVTHAERREYVRELLNTKLKAPYEFVKFHFLIEGVTRAFTHQMVRQRTAVYAQESLRFAVKEDMPVGLPPSLAGTEGGRVSWEERDFTEAERQREHWDNAVRVVGREYNKLVSLGMPAEDARGLLPHNTLTRLHYCTDLRALLDHAGNRLCTQSQFEWRLVFAKIAEAIREYNPYAALSLQAQNMGDDSWQFIDHAAASDQWQYEAIADLFRPVCYQTGKCEFKADFDRKCSIRSRVDANAEIGRAPAHWPNEHDAVQGSPIVSGVGPESVVRDEDNRPVFIGAIRAAEWLLDPGAAR